jgi:hypothetical protein
MKSYYIRLIFVFAAIMTIIPAKEIEAQRFSTSTIQTENFPEIKTNFVAKAPNNTNYTDIQDSDFQILEFVDGVEYDVSSTARVECTPSEEDPEVNILLIIDASRSMDITVEDTEQTRLDFVKQAVSTFIDRVDMVGRTRISTLIFGFNAVINCPWTNDKAELKDSLDNIVLQNATRYLPPINGDSDPDSPNAKILFDDRPDDMPNIVIFLTDGKPSDSDIINRLVDGENFTRGDRAIQDMIDENIIFYSIAIFNNVDPFLNEMSQRTNGRDFKIDSPEKISEVYELLALEIQSTQTCELLWESPYSCTPADRTRRVNINFLKNGLTSVSNYDAGEQSIAQFTLSSQDLFFGNPNIGPQNAVTQTISYIPDNLDVDVTGVSLQPNTNFAIVQQRLNGNPVNPPYTVPAGETLELDVRFTQTDGKIYRQADIVFESEYCMPNVTTYGGIDQVILTGPVDADIENLCDPVNITWTGVAEDDEIEITYSTDNGANWDLIESRATGLSYDWDHPFTDDQPDVQVKLFKKAFNSFLWANSTGGRDNDTLLVIDHTEDETGLMVGGGYERSIVSKGNSTPSNGGKDLLIEYYNAGGELQWRVVGGSPQDDLITGVVEFVNEIFVVGYTYNQFNFGSIQDNSKNPGVKYGFLARIGKDGVVKEQYLLGGDGSAPSFELEPVGIRVFEGNLEIYTRYLGQYTNDLNQIQVTNKNFPLVNNWSGAALTVRLDENNRMQLIDIIPGQRNPALYRRTSVTTPGTDVQYDIGTFSDSREFGSYNVISIGGVDGYITAFGESPSSEDISDPFDIFRPVIEFDITNRPVDFTVVPILATDTKSFPNAIVNTSSLPVVINDFYFQPDDNVFSVLSGLEEADLPITIPPGEALDLEIAFTPNEDRQFNASLILESECANQISLQITGLGECVLEVTENVNLNQFIVGGEDITLVEDIFTNSNGGSIEVEPQLNSPDFSIRSITKSNGDVVYTGDGTGIVSFVVEGGQSLDMEIAFAPQAIGDRTADIDFITNSFCDNPAATLSGEGVNAQLLVDDLDFGQRRVNTVNTGQIRVRNLANAAVAIEGIEFGGTSNGYRLLDINLPFNVPANDEVLLEVEFSPLAENNFNTPVNITQGGGEVLVSNVTGTGTNPTLLPTYNCPIDPEVNIAYEIVVNLENTSQFEATEIQSAAFDFGGDYTLLDGAGGNPVNQLNNLTIPTESNIDIYVRFTPSSAAPAQDILNFVADIAEGNGVDNQVEGTVTVQEEFNCGASDLQEPVDVSFNLLACYDFNTSITVSNPNASTMTINAADVVITGANPEIIDIASLDDVIIPANSTDFEYGFTIRVPDNNTYSATIDLSNNTFNAQRIYNITANGNYITVETQEAAYDQKVGEVTDIVLIAKIPPLDHPIAELDFEMTYDPNVLFFDDLTQNMIFPTAGWSFSVIDENIDVSNNLLRFNSVGLPANITDAGEVELVSLPTTFLLGTTEAMVAEFTVISSECGREPTIVGAEFVTSWECEADYIRTVINSGPAANIQSIAPNPVSDFVNLNVTSPFDIMGTVTLVNTTGSVEAVLFDGIVNQGDNEILLDLSTQPNGLYQLVFQTRVSTETQRLMIKR